MNKIDTSGFTDKASKNPEELKLYQENDFITAYSKHTDLRIDRDGPQNAIGSNGKDGQGWDEHGKAQLGFLISQGLRPKMALLDLGCGTGRLACKAVPYLSEGSYTGIDISEKAIDQCRSLGLDAEFIHGDGSLKPVKNKPFNLIWAHSVLTHTPEDVAEEFFKDLSEMTFGAFFFTYKHADEGYRRSGLKQFQYSPTRFGEMARKNGLKAKPVDVRWPAGQRTMMVWR